MFLYYFDVLNRRVPSPFKNPGWVCCDSGMFLQWCLSLGNSRIVCVQSYALENSNRPLAADTGLKEKTIMVCYPLECLALSDT